MNNRDADRRAVADYITTDHIREELRITDINRIKIRLTKYVSLKYVGRMSQKLNSEAAFSK
jgi:hypothetical protein